MSQGDAPAPTGDGSATHLLTVTVVEDPPYGLDEMKIRLKYARDGFHLLGYFAP